MSEAIASEGVSMTGESVSRPVLLRAAREAAGLHIAALAAALKVPVRKLEALEAGRYDELPDLTFARALASSACRHLKVDPVPVLEQIPQRVVRELGGSKQKINTTFHSAQDPGPINPVSWLSRPALLAAIVLLLGALVIVFLPRIESTSTGQESVAEVPTSPDVAEAVEPVLAQEPEAPTVPAAPDGSASGGVVAGAATPVAPAMLSTPTDATAPTATGLLTISAKGETWIEVVNGTGSMVMQRVLKAGDTLDFSTAPPYKVVIGRADAAQVTVRGKPLDLVSLTRNNVARFEAK
ncbi:RodZ domain-containing protein [Hydrogenophaga sp.]|uniref:RodZ domain-containing protein n=1 Tax=Hydrogenophaga sp. TaxID=1904254 RepID=UPI002722AA22|nr:RodZ domain-containing protein [Hydrogenophaga sp.]MDO9434100.1 DUF4115 domain-containing protein [Hydrogenophaga sp.]